MIPERRMSSPTNGTDKLLTGLLAAPFTPFHPDCSLNLEPIESFARYLKTAGVAGVFVCGSTGEFSSLTLTERKRLAEVWRTATRRQGLQLIVHVGDNCLADSIALAAHAAGLPADGVSALSPSYFKPDDPAALTGYLVPVAEAAGTLPFYYYDIPRNTGVALQVSRWLEQANERLPTLRGVKFTNPDLCEWQRCLNWENGRLNMLFGCDEMLLPALCLGGDGAVGSTYNYLAFLYLDMIEKWRSGALEDARRRQWQSVRLTTLLKQVQPIAAGKALLQRVGFDFGPVRPPLLSLAPDKRAAFDRAVDALEIFGEFSSRNNGTMINECDESKSRT